LTFTKIYFILRPLQETTEEVKDERYDPGKLLRGGGNSRRH
jgi:hypothetical protein